MIRTVVPLIVAGSLVASGGLRSQTPDLRHPPDSGSIASICRAGKLADFRDSLGDALASRWHPAVRGAGGACGDECFGAWVDLYRWLDLLESDEAAVTRRWLLRHLSMKGDKLNGAGKINVTIHQPGSLLVRRYDGLQHRVTGEIAADPVMLGRVMTELVAQPFSSRNGPLLGRLDPGFVLFTMTDPSFPRAWGNAVGEDDFAPKVLLNLESIWKAYPKEWIEYLNLALAVAVVHDQPVPSFWPHRQVLQKDLPKVQPQPADIFGRLVEAFREGRLKRDPRQLDPGELKYVVDAPLDPSEFELIRNSPQLSREDPGRAFGAIIYDSRRVDRNSYLWPWGRYSLAQIRNRGGICVDQAYYAAMACKSIGIPSIFFAGLGKEGGHAWIGFLKGNGAWDLNVGRNEGGTCLTGEALDPQNWTPVTDHDVEVLRMNSRGRLERDASQRDLGMAVHFRRRHNAEAEGRAIQSALSRCPNNSLIWDAREDWLIRTGSSRAEIKGHHEAAIRQFSRFRDLKTQHEQALARLTAEAGDMNAAERISKRIVRENRGVRSDLSALAAISLIQGMVDAGDPEGALKEYEKQLRLQGESGGGDFFYRVTSPFATLFISKGRPDLSRRVLKNTYDVLRPNKGSLLGKDFKKLWLASGGKA
jgi:hypothetical protein